MKKIKAKIDEIVIKAYVKYTVMLWEVEDLLDNLINELKRDLKMFIKR